MRPLKEIGLLLPLTLLGGCQSTGDPNQGGLFGWDENKAKQRQQAQVNVQQAKQKEINRLQIENAELEGKTSENAETLEQLNNTIRKLHDEQITLGIQIRELYEHNKLSEKRLRELENEYTWLNVDKTEQGDVFVEINQADLAKVKMQQMEQENKVLVEQILLLIGQ